MRIPPAFAAFQDGRKGPQAKKCGYPIEAGKSKETNSP